MPEALREDFWEPLLTSADLATMMPDKDPRTIRRDLAEQRWPVIDLGERIRHVRSRDVAAEVEGRAGKRSVRRNGATKG